MDKEDKFSETKAMQEKAKALVKRFYELSKEVEEQISKVTEKKGLSLKKLKEFYAEKSNFSAEKWAALQKEKERFDNQFHAFKKKETSNDQTNKHKSKAPANKRASRARYRSSWLSM